MLDDVKVTLWLLFQKVSFFKELYFSQSLKNNFKLQIVMKMFTRFHSMLGVHSTKSTWVKRKAGSMLFSIHLGKILKRDILQYDNNVNVNFLILT